MIINKELKVTREKFLSSMLMGNFRFRYAWIENFGEYNHKHLFVIGERSDDPGIPVIEEIRRGQVGADLRIWYVDIELPEENRYLNNVPYEYPLPLSPVFIAYDGNKYMYVVYNKYKLFQRLKEELKIPREIKCDIDYNKKVIKCDVTKEQDPTFENRVKAEVGKVYVYMRPFDVKIDASEIKKKSSKLLVLEPRLICNLIPTKSITIGGLPLFNLFGKESPYMNNQYLS